MQIAIIQKQKIIKIGDHRELFPNVSFPASGPDADWLKQNSCVSVSAYKQHDSSKQRLVSSKPHLIDDTVYIVDVQSIPDSELTILKNARVSDIRVERNRRISECDWTQLPDADLTAEQRQEWVKYRQTLRDITKQTDLDNIVWPISPSDTATLQE